MRRPRLSPDRGQGVGFRFQACPFQDLGLSVLGCQDREGVGLKWLNRGQA